LSRRLLPWLMLAGLAPAWGQPQPYRNPVIGLAETETADPYVLKHNGEYYLYTSGDPIVAWHSRDLVRWTRIGPVLRSTAGAWNEADVWAPEVIYRNGKFLMYYTASRKSSDWRVGEMARRVGLAVSDSPRGPFVDAGKPVLPGWAIDGNVLQHPVSGQDYMFYSFLQEPQHPGAGIAVDKMLSWDRSAGQPLTVTEGSVAWEDKDADPFNGSLRYTNEGPTTLFRHGKFYCLYSGGSWDLPTYSVAYAVAPRIEGPWTKVDPPILRSTPWVDGPGHNALVKAPNNVDDIHFYHARLQPYVDPGNRVPFADRLFWNGDRPWTPPPTLGYLPAPDRPLLWERFDGAELEQWAGKWPVENGVARASSGELLSRVPLPRNFVLESNIRLGSPGGLAGIRLGTYRLQLDGRQKALTLNDQPLWAWPADFHPTVFHQLLVRNNGGTWEIEVDGVRHGVSVTPLPGDWALLSATGGDEFDGIALSAAFDDDFGAGVRGWEPVSGQWARSGAVFRQSGRAGVALKGEPATRYEFSATLQPEDPSSPLVERPGPTDLKWKAGIVAGDGSGVRVTAGFDKAIWPLGKFWVQAPGRTISVGMPRGFRYDVPHTIRVLRQEDLWTFFLDGREIATSRFACGPTRPGLWSDGVATAFHDAAWKRIQVEQNWLLDGGFETEQAGGDAAWQLAGSARLNESQAHSGLRRLLIHGKPGEASQPLTLPAGRYRVHAFATGTPGSRLSIGVGAASQVITPQRAWEPAELTFTVAAGDKPVLRLSGATDGWLAVDDVFITQL
jgi:GH43 family beta-xylosidase